MTTRSQRRHPPPASAAAPQALPTSGPVQLSVGLGSTTLIVTLPSGKIITIEPDGHGMKRLLRIVRANAVPTMRNVIVATTRASTQKPYSPADMERVCFCGLVVAPFMVRCEDCPGTTGHGFQPKQGQGAVRKYTTSGKPIRQAPPSLEELDL